MQDAEAWEPNGYLWLGERPRVPFYISRSLIGNIPYDGTFEEGVEAIIAAANEWNDWNSDYLHGGSNFEFYYAGLTNVATVADDGINAIIFVDGQCPGNCSAWINYHREGSVMHGFDIRLFSIAGFTPRAPENMARTSLGRISGARPNCLLGLSVIAHMGGHYGTSHAAQESMDEHRETDAQSCIRLHE